MMLSEKRRKSVLLAGIVLSTIILSILYFITKPAPPPATPPLPDSTEFIDGKDLKEPVLAPFDTDSKELSKSKENQEYLAIKKKAQEGDAYSQAVVAEILRRGEMDVQPNVDAALEWAKKSADQEHPLGLYNLAIIYRRGYYDGRDFSKSDELFKKSIPGLKIMAAQGDIRALYNLGFLYTYGICIEKNKQEAIRLLKAAAEKGCLNTEKLIKINEYPEQPPPEDQEEDEE